MVNHNLGVCMIRLYFIGQDVPDYLVSCNPQRLVSFGSLFTVVYKKQCNFYVNGFFGRCVIKVDIAGCDGKFNLIFHEYTRIKQII